MYDLSTDEDDFVLTTSCSACLNGEYSVDAGAFDVGVSEVAVFDVGVFEVAVFDVGVFEVPVFAVGASVTGVLGIGFSGTGISGIGFSGTGVFVVGVFTGMQASHGANCTVCLFDSWNKAIQNHRTERLQL